MNKRAWKAVGVTESEVAACLIQYGMTEPEYYKEFCEEVRAQNLEPALYWPKYLAMGFVARQDGEDWATIISIMSKGRYGDGNKG